MFTLASESETSFYFFNILQDGYAVIASDGPGEYPIITESRAGNDGVGLTVTPGTVAYVTTGGESRTWDLSQV